MNDSYILDANVVFSGLISGKEKYRQVFAKFKFYFLDYGLSEIQNYQDVILKKTKLNPKALREYTLQLFSELTIVPNFLISDRNYIKAFQLCKDIDEKDTPYVALAIQFDIELITKDDELVEGLRSKGFTKIISLKEFLDAVDLEE